MPASSPDPVRVLLAGFGVVFALGLALIAWAGRDTNPPILVEPEVEVPSDELARIDAGTDDAERSVGAIAAVDFVAGADPLVGADNSATPLRTSVGVPHTWREALRPYDVRTGGGFETFDVLWFAADGERREHRSDDALAAAAFATDALITVVVPGFAPRVTTGAAVAGASDEQRRLPLHPTSTVRVELEPGATWDPQLSLALLTSKNAEAMNAIRRGPELEFDVFADHLRELLDDGTSDMRRSTLIATLRTTPYFEPVTSLAARRRTDWGSAPYLAPFGISKAYGGLVLPVVVEDFAVIGPLAVLIVADAPVDLVRRVGVEVVAEFRTFAHRGFMCEDGDDVTVYVRPGPAGGYFGRLPFAASDAQFDSKFRTKAKNPWASVRTTSARDGVVVSDSPIELAVDGTFEWRGARPGLHRLVARWSEPGGVVAFCDVEFEVAAGEFVDLGVLAPTPNTVVRTHMRFVDRDGIELEDFAARLYGFELDGRLEGANSILEVFADDQPIIDVVTFTADRTTLELRGLPVGALGLRPLALRLPPTSGEAWAVATSFAATPFTPIDGAAIDVDVPIEIEAQVSVRLQVPLEGDLYAPGIHYTGAALRRSTGDNRYFAFTWSNAGYSEVELELPVGDWEIHVAATTPRTHPVHPNAVWHASTTLRLDPGPPVERVLRVAPGATLRATGSALAFRHVDLDPDLAAVLEVMYVAVPVDFPGFSALHRRAHADEDGIFTFEHLAPDVDYEMSSSGVGFTTGRSGSIQTLLD